jgi:hypothetical protein
MKWVNKGLISYSEFVKDSCLAVIEKMGLFLEK